MKQYQALATKEKSWFKQFSIQQVPWGQNEKADKLARLTLSTMENLDPRIFIESLTKLSIEVKEGKEVNIASLELE